jgi:hypothetical protein
MLDYRPDLDPRTPGLVTDLQDMVPSARGYKVAYGETAYTAFTYSLDGAGETYPAKIFATRWLGSSGGILLVATNHKISIFNKISGFQDVSKGGGYSIGGGGYLWGEDSPAAWDICAFGDMIIAVNQGNATQNRSATDLSAATKFADLAGAPSGITCCAAQNFAFIGGCGNWSTVTGSPDILAWCALGDYTNWVPSPLTTQASYAQFNDTPGPITCVEAFRDGIVVFKGSSMYYGRYVGTGTYSPIWDFQRISSSIGCLSHRSCVNIDRGLVFVDRNNIYLYDGSRPYPITDGIYSLIRDYLTDGGKAMQVAYDEYNSSVWFSGVASGYIFVWDFRLNRWGKLVTTGSNSNQPTFCDTNTNYFGVGHSFGGVSNSHTNLRTLYFVQGNPFNRFTSKSSNTNVTTGIFGQRGKLSTLTRVTPHYAVRPSSIATFNCSVSTSATEGDLTFLGPVAMDANYRFDTLALGGTTANCFQLSLGGIVDYELIDIEPTFVAAGTN